MEKSFPPSCKCGQLITIYQLFNECTQYTAIKNRLGINGASIGDDDINTTKNVIKFLKKTNLYNKI